MTTLRYTFGLMATIIGTLFRKTMGISPEPKWDSKTAMVHASTRYTLLASHRFGLGWLKRMSNSFSPKPVFKDQITAEELSRGSVSYLAITPTETHNPQSPLLVYFHGGGYVQGSPSTSIEYLSRLAIYSEMPVFAVHYPTAPEHSYPAAHVAAHDALVSILKEYQERKVFVGGDSAGAALALSAVRACLAEHKDQIVGCPLISPWTEPTATGGSIESNSATDIGDGQYLLNCYGAYVAGAQEQAEYPLTFHSKNLPTLPRTLITIGSHEMLWDQAQRLQDMLKANGTPSVLQSYPKMFHTFWALPQTLPLADAFIKDLAGWMKE